MPEYLAPAVYVEEVDTGSKPIEGVSTSTAGMIGVTERGPVNVPTLVTSYGEFQRIFGQTLSPALYDEHRFLPHAVEGFFVNGGKRVYVTRIVGGAAAPAERTLVAADAAAPPATQMALGAAAGAGSVVVISSPGLTAGDTVQIGGGAGAEFRAIGAPTAAALIALNLPLAYGHAASVPLSVEAIPNPADATGADIYSSTLAAPAAAGSQSITVASATATNAIAANQLLRIGSGDREEYVLTGGAPSGTSIPLAAPLQLSHAATTVVVRQAPPAAATQTTQLPVPTGPGAALVLLNATAGFTTGKFARFVNTTTPSQNEIRLMGTPTSVALTQPAYADYPAGSIVERVTLPAVSPGSFDLTADAEAGATVIHVSDRSQFLENDVVRIGVGVDQERIAVAALPAPLPGPNPGAIVMRGGLRVRHQAATAIVRRIGPATAVTRVAVLAADAAANSNQLIVTSGNGLASGDILRVTPANGGPFYHGIAPTPAPAAVVAQTLPLAPPLTFSHAASSQVVVRAPMALVRALDAGVWGNRLRAAMETHAEPLLTTTVRQPVSATSLRLRSVAGVEAGSELVITDAANVETTVKVASIDLQNDALITLEATTPVVGLAPNDRVHSREYRFVVELLRQPDPANPARNNLAIDREGF